VPVQAAAVPSLGSLGCCLQQFDVGDTGSSFSCSVATEAQCFNVGPAFFGVDVDFVPGQVCNAAGDACVPFFPPGIVTSTTLALRPADCFTADATPSLLLPAGSDVSVCGVICNAVGSTLTRFTLFIDPFAQPEFSNLASSLVNNSCTGVVKTLSANIIPKFAGPGDRLIVANSWCASKGSLTAGDCPPPDANSEVGTSGGEPVFRDTERALLVREALQGAPALDGWGLNLLTTVLVAFGIWRLSRSARPSR
jgi:hypothetical protein